MEIRRKEHWQLALSNYFDEVAYKAFKWGEHDCSLFAASAVEAMTGHDFAAAFRGQYDDARGAALALRNYGEGTLLKTVTACFGKPRHIAHAKRGDVVMYQRALGICCGTFTRFVGSVDESGSTVPARSGELPTGLIPMPTHLCQRVWHVKF